MPVSDVKPTEKPLSWFKPFPGNPRKDLKQGDPEYESLKRSIQRFGHVQLIVANKDGTVIGGHQTLKILKDLGHEKAKCVVLDLDKNDEVALNLALNKITGDWNEPVLGEILKHLDANGYDTDITGFNKDEIGELLDRLEMQRIREEGGAEEEVPAVPKKPETKKGDLWILGEHRLLCGDASDEKNWKRLLGDERIDLSFSDPPYGIDYAEKNRFLNSFQPSGRNLEDITNDALSKDELLKMLVSIYSLANAYAHDHCSFYVTAPQGGELGLMMMMMMMMMSGLPVRHVLIWNKNSQNFSLGRLDYEYKHEPILYAWKKTHKFNGQGEFHNSVWDIPKETKCDVHPTMKPVRLVTNCLLNSSKRGDIVCDFFGGSGTTLISCEQNERKCRMIELEPGYCDVIKTRWETLTGNSAVKGA